MSGNRLAAFLAKPLQPGDYYLTPQGYMVFTEQYHQRRGFCCGNGCRHCPWQAAKGQKPGPEDGFKR